MGQTSEVTPQVLHATATDGSRRPVVDVTHPAFALSITDAQLAEMSDQYLHQSASRQEVPPAVRQALGQSILGRALMAAAGTYLTGMSTYLLKLGPDHLGPDATPIDRSIAASLPAVAARLRLQDMARLLADGLSSLMTASEEKRPLCLVNIAGGPAADSWNALIHLRAEDAHLLADRHIVIAVLEVDRLGPAFGRSAIEALQDGGPLEGINIDFRDVPYDWCRADRLVAILEDLKDGAAGPRRDTDPAYAISSEGGLFEYGTDEEIVSNLERLYVGTPTDAIVVASVTNDSELVRASQSSTRIPTRPRTFDAFESLVTQAGWMVQRAIDRPFSCHVRLVKQQMSAPDRVSRG